MLRVDKKVENLRKLLLTFFKHIVGYFETLDSFNDELSLFGLNRMERLYFTGSITGRLSVEFGKHHSKIDYVFNFLRWYVQGVLKWYELLSSLIRALGCADWFSVYREEIKIEEVVDFESVDLTLLALNVRSAVELTLPELKNALLNVARESKSMPEWLAFFLSEKALEFIRLSGEMAESWLKIQEDILNRLEDTRLDLAERIVDIIKIMVTFKEELMRVEDIFALEERILKDASLEDLWNLSDIFKRAQSIVGELFRIKRKSFECVSNAYLLILSALCGSEAAKILSELVEFQKKPADIVPEKVPVEDLYFALVLARIEIEACLQENKLLKEKLKAINVSRILFKGLEPVLVYGSVEKRVRLHKTFCNRVSETLFELQEELNKIR